MKTPMQELIDWLNFLIAVLPEGAAKNQLIIARNKAESMLEKEKEVMVDFAYKCRNLMAADEFAISKWYDKTFDSDTNSDTAPTQNVK